MKSQLKITLILLWREIQICLEITRLFCFFCLRKCGLLCRDDQLIISVFQNNKLNLEIISYASCTFEETSFDILS